MGPMIAAARFIRDLRRRPLMGHNSSDPSSINVRLHGSLAFTGKGHATDRAVVLGLLEQEPATLDPDAAEGLIENLRRVRYLEPSDLPSLKFDPETDLIFDYGLPLARHANGMTFEAFCALGHVIHRKSYYSVGGGFVLDEDEIEVERARRAQENVLLHLPFGFKDAAGMLQMGRDSGLTIAQMKRANEEASGVTNIDERLDSLTHAMNACIDRGLRQEGILGGGLKVRRRARSIHQALLADRLRNETQPHVVNDWLSVYAIAVNEENAAGGRVVTAPTNGAAGTVPSVLRYWQDHIEGTDEARRDFLLTAAAIGGIIKFNASISGAEVGCQGEVGSAASMAAAGLCSVLGGSNEQIENAAEIALEHHLGMTCDPAGGLVQVPCIERNAFGAIKAVSAASLALRGNGQHFMPLDNCIRVMAQTGRDMDTKYKETSMGGIAVNMPAC